MDSFGDITITYPVDMDWPTVVETVFQNIVIREEDGLELTEDEWAMWTEDFDEDVTDQAQEM